MVVFRSGSILLAPSLVSYSGVRGRCRSKPRLIRYVVDFLCVDHALLVGFKESMAASISSPCLLELAVRNVSGPHYVSPASRSGYRVVAEKMSHSHW